MLKESRYIRFAGLLPRLKAERLVARCLGEGVSLPVGGRYVQPVVKLDQRHDLKASALADDVIRDLAVEPGA